MRRKRKGTAARRRAMLYREMRKLRRKQETSLGTLGYLPLSLYWSYYGRNVRLKELEWAVNCFRSDVYELASIRHF